MNYLLLVFSGIVIGLMVAAPIGPVNLICIRRSLAFGPANGFVSGLGAALGDAVFAVVTAFGLTAIAKLIEGFFTPLQILGGVMLIGFGIHTFFSKPDKDRLDNVKRSDTKGKGLFGVMVSTFALTITNPATLFGFAALMTGLGSLIGEKPDFSEAAVLVAGVAAGSAGWWLIVAALVGLFHKSIDNDVMKIINHVMGAAITLFGLTVLGNMLVAQFTG